MEQQVTEVEQEVITTFKKTSEFRHCPIHYIQLHRYTMYSLCTQTIFWHGGILGSGLN